MKWSWKVGRLAGIDLKIHATFLLILLWVGIAHWIESRTLFSVFAGIAFVMAIFACVVLHELGHAVVARRFGIRTRDITLLPIGGLARLERMPDDPKQEIWVALAGPAVNVVIAAALFVMMQIVAPSQPVTPLSLSGGSILQALMIVNLILIAFNLLPAFPMDGGRVLRGLLATRLDYARATRIAASIGQAMALLFGIVGFFYNPFLIFIAAFVWFGASQEANLAQMKSVLGGISVERAMLTNYAQLAPHDSLARAVDLILAGSQEDFPVVEDGHVIGLLTRNDLVTGLTQQGQTGEVREVMHREFPVVDASEMLESVFPRLQSTDCRIIPVTRFGELVGLITMENVGEFIMIRSALNETKRAA